MSSPRFYNRSTSVSDIHKLSLSDDLTNVKLFADDTSLFFVVYNVADEVNNDLVNINKWAYQRKMSFTPDPIKQAEEVIFTRNIRKEDQTRLVFEQ